MESFGLAGFCNTGIWMAVAGVFCDSSASRIAVAGVRSGS